MRTGFEGVRDAFLTNFTERGEVGAGVHVMVNGEAVVDLVGGWTDADRTQTWGPETLVDIYSVGKAILGVLALRLIDQELLELDQPIADIWPEFGAGGKENATIAHALSHRAGVPAIREVISNDQLFDWDTMVNAIARTEAWYRPGERLVYHTNTFGHLLGEIVHRASGEMPGAQLRRIAKQVDADVWFGVPEEHQHRCAEVIWAPSSPVPVFTSF